MTTQKSSIEVLKDALAIAEQIEKLEHELRRLLGGAATTPIAAGVDKKPMHKKGRLSADTMERIRAAQKARWLKVKQQAGTKALNPGMPTGPQPPKKSAEKGEKKTKTQSNKSKK